MPTCVDCFCGAGGLSLGLIRSGFSILAAFDNDPNCVETLRMNRAYFDHPIEEAEVDRMLNGALIETAGVRPGELDLLAGGPPCQGFSLQRIGEDKDSRNDLLFKFMELVRELTPKFFLIENVKGLAGRRGRSYLKAVLEEASLLGYFPHVAILDAQDFSVPQRRMRVFVVGEMLRKGSAPRYSFPLPTTPPGSRITVRDAIGHLPTPPLDGSDHPEWLHHRRDRLSEINKRRLRALSEGQGRDHLPTTLLADCHKRSSAEVGHRNVYGRMSWSEVAPTITARFDSFTRGKFGHPSDIRSITLREGAELQTFPSDFAFSGNKVQIARQIGNAVPVRLAEAMGRSILACIGKPGDA